MGHLEDSGHRPVGASTLTEDREKGVPQRPGSPETLAMDLSLQRFP